MSKSVSAAAATAFRALAQSRRTSRRFQRDRMIPEGTMRDILESTLRSPSSFNLQPSQIILVQNDDVKNTLADEAMLGPGNQYRTRDASAVAVFLSDLEPTKRISRVAELEEGHRHPNYLASLPLASSFLIGEGHAATFLKNAATDLVSHVQPTPAIEPVQAWSYKNTGLLAASYVYAASSHDLATCIMEGFDPRRTKEILRIPERYAVPLMVATGYEYEDPSDFVRVPRLSVEESVFGDAFGSPLRLSEDSDEGGCEADKDSADRYKTAREDNHLAKQTSSP